MRFGFWPNPRSNYEATKTLAQHAEVTGWDGIWLADHFLPDDNELVPVHESWVTMAALARDVGRVRLGSLVTGNTYRHPAVLANMAATLDNLSGGRLVLGLGSGWQKNEHEAYGIEYGTTGWRLRKLDEACQVIKGLFNESHFDFDGEFYQLNKAPMEPKPRQKNLPLMIGGGAILSSTVGATLTPQTGIYPLIIAMFLTMVGAMFASAYVRHVDKLAAAEAQERLELDGAPR